MNIRKNTDYSEMYEELSKLVAKDILQMELYCNIGRAVCQRVEKGAAVAAAEYLSSRYPDVRGFSPRNLRRIRDFYRMYENEPKLMALTMELNWTQNVVIMEADLTIEQREWYMRAAKQFKWSKTELFAHIAACAHENIILAADDECYVWKEQKKCTVKVVAIIAKRMVCRFAEIGRRLQLNQKVVRRRRQWGVRHTKTRSFLHRELKKTSFAMDLQGWGGCLNTHHSPGFVEIECGCGKGMKCYSRS